MAINPELLKDTKLVSKYLDHETETAKIITERGWLGNFWGSTSSIPNNIAATLILISILTGLVYTYCAFNSPPNSNNISIKDFWSIMSPFITLPLGYLFGMKKKD